MSEYVLRVDVLLPCFSEYVVRVDVPLPCMSEYVLRVDVLLPCMSEYVLRVVVLLPCMSEYVVRVDVLLNKPASAGKYNATGCVLVTDQRQLLSKMQQAVYLLKTSERC